MGPRPLKSSKKLQKTFNAKSDNLTFYGQLRHQWRLSDGALLARDISTPLLPWEEETTPIEKDPLVEGIVVLVHRRSRLPTSTMVMSVAPEGVGGMFDLKLG